MPFLLLERTYISDRELSQPLTIVAAPGARKRIEELCEIAYPGSLEKILSMIEWDENAQGSTKDGWSWNRFEVNHNDSVDPLDIVSNLLGERNSFIVVILGLVIPCTLQLAKQI